MSNIHKIKQEWKETLWTCPFSMVFSTSQRQGHTGIGCCVCCALVWLICPTCSKAGVQDTSVMLMPPRSLRDHGHSCFWDFFSCLREHLSNWYFCNMASFQMHLVSAITNSKQTKQCWHSSSMRVYFYIIHGKIIFLWEEATQLLLWVLRFEF